MSGSESTPQQNESLARTTTLLEQAVDGIPFSSGMAHSMDLRRLHSNLPYLSEFYIEELLRGGLKERPKTPFMWRIIESALNKLPGEHQLDYSIQVSGPFSIHEREARAKIDKSMAETELVIRETAYDGQIVLNGKTYQFRRSEPVYSIRKYVYVDLASNVSPTLDYEFAPSPGYLAKVVTVEDGRGIDEIISDGDRMNHLSAIKEVAEGIIEHSNSKS